MPVRSSESGTGQHGAKAGRMEMEQFWSDCWFEDCF